METLLECNHHRPANATICGIFKSPTLRQSELRSHTQFFYFCLKGVPAIIIPSIRLIPN